MSRASRPHSSSDSIRSSGAARTAQCHTGLLRPRGPSAAFGWLSNPFSRRKSRRPSGRSSGGYWCLPEADLGFPVTPAMFAVIAAKLPGRTAQEAILTGRRYGGPDAAAAGIVHQVASEDQVLARAVQLAAGLASKERRTLAEHKRMLYGEAIKTCGA